MNATKKNSLAAANLVQSNPSEARPDCLIARILDLETVAADALDALRQAEAKAIADAAAAASAAPVDVLALAKQVADLQAQLAAATPKGSA